MPGFYCKRMCNLAFALHTFFDTFPDCFEFFFVFIRDRTRISADDAGRVCLCFFGTIRYAIFSSLQLCFKLFCEFFFALIVLHIFSFR